MKVKGAWITLNIPNTGEYTIRKKSIKAMLKETPRGDAEQKAHKIYTENKAFWLEEEEWNAVYNELTKKQASLSELMEE